MPIVPDEGKRAGGKKRFSFRIAALLLVGLPLTLLLAGLSVPFLACVKVPLGGKILALRGYRTAGPFPPPGWHSRSGKNAAGAFTSTTFRIGQTWYFCEWADAGTFQDLPPGSPWD